MEFIIKDHLPMVVGPLKNEEGPTFIVIGPNAGGVRKTGSTKEIGSKEERSEAVRCVKHLSARRKK